MTLTQSCEPAVGPPGLKAEQLVSSRWWGELVTSSGFAFRVRPAGPEDHDALAAFFARLTPDDLRFRFLSSLKQVDEQRLFDMTHVDHRGTESFLAEDLAGGEILATATLAADGEQKRAEVAIATRPDHKRRGIATMLLEHVSHYARSAGIELLEAIACRENCAVIELEKKLGFTLRPLPGDTTLVLLQRRLQ